MGGLNFDHVPDYAYDDKGQLCINNKELYTIAYLLNKILTGGTIAGASQVQKYIYARDILRAHAYAPFQSIGGTIPLQINTLRKKYAGYLKKIRIALGQSAPANYLYVYLFDAPPLKKDGSPIADGDLLGNVSQWIDGAGWNTAVSTQQMAIPNNAASDTLIYEWEPFRQAAPTAPILAGYTENPLITDDAGITYALIFSPIACSITPVNVLKIEIFYDLIP